MREICLDLERGEAAKTRSRMLPILRSFRSAFPRLSEPPAKGEGVGENLGGQESKHRSTQERKGHAELGVARSRNRSDSLYPKRKRKGFCLYARNDHLDVTVHVCHRQTPTRRAGRKHMDNNGKTPSRTPVSGSTSEVRMSSLIVRYASAIMPHRSSRRREALRDDCISSPGWSLWMAATSF